MANTDFHSIAREAILKSWSRISNTHPGDYKLEALEDALTKIKPEEVRKGVVTLKFHGEEYHIFDLSKKGGRKRYVDSTLAASAGKGISPEMELFGGPGFHYEKGVVGLYTLWEKGLCPMPPSEPKPPIAAYSPTGHILI